MKTTILGVTGDKMTEFLLQRILELEGYDVVIARDGNEAWEFIQSHVPQVVLSSWNPPGMDGCQLCRRIKEDPRLRRIYFIVVTTARETDQRMEALRLGADEFLSKPVDLVELKARVAAGLRIVKLNRELENACVIDPATGQPGR